jgi:hypothetical protein
MSFEAPAGFQTGSIGNAIHWLAAGHCAVVPFAAAKNRRCNDVSTPIAFFAMVLRCASAGVKREHGGAFQANPMAAPATVSGEQNPTRHWPNGREGRMALRPASQETCHQRELTGRGVPGGSSKAVSTRHARHPSVP